MAANRFNVVRQGNGVKQRGAIKKSIRNKGGAGVSTATQLSSHAIQRIAARGVGYKMAQITIKKGLKFYDPCNRLIN
jgi:predicted Fe-Mo cluster-binding NifX family protein